MFYPKLRSSEVSTSLINRFLGYNHNADADEAEFYRMSNLSGRAYPAISTRPVRSIGTPGWGSSPVVGVCQRDVPAFATADGAVHAGGHSIQGLLAAVTGDETKTMVSMGAYVIVWPDKAWFNCVKLAAGTAMTAGDDYGSLEFSWTQSTEVLTVELCDATGRQYGTRTFGMTAPESPSNGALWYDMSGRAPALKCWSESSGMWLEVGQTWLRISRTGLFRQLGAGDGISLTLPTFAQYEQDGKWYPTPLHIDAADGVIYARKLSDNDILVQGYVLQDCKLPDTRTQLEQCGYLVETQATHPDQGTWPPHTKAEIDAMTDQEIKDYCDGWNVRTYMYIEAAAIQRSAPELDFVTECGNRLWGCRYGMQDGKHINEIYASALGDFKVWHRYAGASTDSYAASRGADGAFTGAITLDGHPLFFREDGVEKVYPSNTGAHQISWTPLDGVQEGCGESLRRCGSTVYYKARRGVMAYDGALPQLVSDALGPVSYGSACAGVQDGMYYISMQAAGGSWHLFCLDTQYGRWWREDGTRAQLWLNWDGALLFRRGSDKKLLCTAPASAAAAATGTAISWQDDPEPVRWSAETGNIGMRYGGHKYLSRFDFRMELGVGAQMRVEVQFDSSGQWEPRGTVQGQGLRTFVLPVRGRRCDHMRIRLVGVGACRIVSMLRTMEKGSDYGWR